VLAFAFPMPLVRRCADMRCFNLQAEAEEIEEIAEVGVVVVEAVCVPHPGCRVRGQVGRPRRRRRRSP
jgi:hypothetical protein